MTDKLTDKEIIKFFEKMSERGFETLSWFDKEIGMIKIVSIADIIDLINRLQAENERLKPFEDKIAEFNSHIRVENMLVFASSLEEWLEFCDNLKAEAYKECIKKVKEEYADLMEFGYADISVDGLFKKLDNILKEMGHE